MASSNTIKNDILALFPDNNTREISASDVRAFVEGVFGDREVVIVKIATASDLASQSSKIFEDSIVIVYNEPANNGVYLSVTNNPYSLTQLKKIAGLLEGTATGNLSSDGSVPMDSDYFPSNPKDLATKEYADSLSSGNPYPAGTVENFLFTFNAYKVAYEANFVYDIGGNLETKYIKDDTTTYYSVGFNYTDGVLTSKVITDQSGNFCTTTFAYIDGILDDKSNVLTLV